MGVAEIRQAPRSRTKLKTKRVAVLRNVEGNDDSRYGEHWLGLLDYGARLNRTVCALTGYQN